MNTLIITACVILAGIVLLLIAKYVPDYKIDKDGIHRMIVGVVPLWFISYNNIEEVKVIESNIHLTVLYRAPFCGEVIMIKLKKGIIKTIIIADKNPNEMCRNIIVNMQNYTKKSEL